MTIERTTRSNATTKSDSAFRTIGEVSTELGIPQHVLRYWEGRFPQLKPLQRAGNRRYYRPDDILLLKRIQRLLDSEGYSIRGVQKLLESKTGRAAAPLPATPATIAVAQPAMPIRAEIRSELLAMRDLLAIALARA